MNTNEVQVVKELFVKLVRWEKIKRAIGILEGDDGDSAIRARVMNSFSTDMISEALHNNASEVRDVLICDLEGELKKIEEGLRVTSTGVELEVTT